MGSYDYKDDPQVFSNYSAAELELERHMGSHLDNSQNLALYRAHIEAALKVATLKIARYQRAVHINMEKVELLRDVVFLGASLVETGKGGEPYYRALVRSCFDITMTRTRSVFERSFIKKISESKPFFYGQEFNAVAFYLLFKSHFRITDQPQHTQTSLQLGA